EGTFSKTPHPLSEITANHASRVRHQKPDSHFRVDPTVILRETVQLTVWRPLSGRIVIDPEVLAGEPVIRGTRLTREFKLELLAAASPSMMSTLATISQNWPRPLRLAPVVQSRFALAGAVARSARRRSQALLSFRRFPRSYPLRSRILPARSMTADSLPVLHSRTATVSSDCSAGAA